MTRTATALLCAAIGAQTADAGTLRGRVIAPAGGSGEAAGISGVWVWLDGGGRTRTDEAGEFALEVPERPGIVWARVPDGYQPGAAWRPIRGSAEPIDISLVPTHARGPKRFVHVSDAHIGKKRYGGGRFGASGLSDALAQALAHPPGDPPAFFVMTGDITNLETPGELDEAASVLLHQGIPFVAVPGNHDWVARGRNYKKVFGPPNFSFDSGGVHFVVLNDNWRKPPDMRFLAADLETVEGDPPVVAFVHRPPADAYLKRMDALGVDVLLTGHWHSNRHVSSGGLWQINTQAIVRGGIDFTPAGYRIIGYDDSGRLQITHGTITERPEPRITWPVEGGCLAPGRVDVMVAAEPRSVDGPIEIAIDGGARLPLSQQSGWVYAAAAGELAPGAHRLALIAGGQTTWRDLDVCAERPAIAGGEWLQHAGSGTRTNAALRPIAPPLDGLWATAVGQHVLGGSPAVAGGRVLVPMSDLDDGDGGGVVALELETGVERWRVVTGHSVRGTPAVSGDLAVFGDTSGVVHAVELETGARRWQRDLGEGIDNTQSALISGVAVDDQRAFAVVIGRLAALDLATGEIVWEDREIGGGRKANMSSRSAPGLADDLVVATAGWGKGGLVGFDPATGARRWQRKPKRAEGINSAPVIAGDSVLIADSWGWVRALDRASGKQRWKHRVAPNGNSLSLSVAATPAVARGVAVIPTQYHSLIALDADLGTRMWTHEVDTASVHTAHDERVARSVTSSPVIAGEIVWFGGADGRLRAVDLTTGTLLESFDLGAPILAGPAPAGDVLVVATYDGVVRAFASAPLPKKRSVFGFVGIMFAIGAIGWWLIARRPV